jgi:hypothetical protein
MNFDDFKPGVSLGALEFDLDRKTIAEWSSLFPASETNRNSKQIPAGFVAVVAMRAYTHVCSIRPPGNIHGEQSYEIVRLPEIGSTIVTEVACTAKEIKRERRWLTFETTTRSRSGESLFRGVMRIAWSR